MLALSASVPLADPYTYLPRPDHQESGPTIYLPPSWSLWPVQVVAPEPAPFFAHDHTGWGLIPREQAEKLRLAGEGLLDRALAYMMGQIDISTFTNAHTDFYKKVQRLIKTGDDQPRPQKARPPETGEARQYTIEGQRLAAVLYNLLGLEVKPICGTCRNGNYRFTLHPDTQRGDGVDVERLRPDRTDHVICMTPAFTRAELEVAMADVDRQYEEIASRLGRPRFAQAVNEHGARTEVVIERGPIKASQPDAAADKERLDDELKQHFWRGFTEKAEEQAAARANRQQSAKPAPWTANAGLMLKGGNHVQ